MSMFQEQLSMELGIDSAYIATFARMTSLNAYPSENPMGTCRGKMS